MTKLHEIQIPFAGFYCSIHDETETDRLSDYADFEIPDSLMDLFHEAADFSNYCLKYSQAYAAAFAEEYFSDLGEFSGLTSPREYNFETDRIFMKVPSSTILEMFSKTPTKTLVAAMKERHTSYDGFWSHYSNKLEDWPLSPLEWDHNQLQTLLMAHLFEERGEAWDMYAEHSLVEDLETSDWLWTENSDRPWKIFNHLQERSERTIKTVAEWFAANQKPWQTTPLGSI